ncbi:hypothetical protein BGW37DRAFT_310852 [Umbelopsis sp. PMI_123]|nr:hypothetical protein BGW37DRAFT_310852 [Umbelopsis sp. PMI_123]
MRECGRRVSFLIAEKSMHQRGIGMFARMIHAIPVIRPQDLAKPGQGRIQLLNTKTDPLRITGIDTKFTKELQPKYSIVLPKNVAQMEVVQVISDTEILIKKEVKELKGLALLTSPEGSAYKCIPHVEQDSVYKVVHDELNNNQCITIFPEGGSHDRAEMLPLKAGVTLMAMGAMAKYPGLDVKIVPCGLNYFHPHRFRSRAVIEFGDPITISLDMVEKFKEGGTTKREVCSKLLDIIYNALKSVTVNASNYETLMMIQAARRLYKPAHRKLHISQVVDLNRRFVIGYNIYKDDPKVIELQHKVLAYNQLLKYHGLKDHQVPKTNLRRRETFALLSYRLMLLSVWGILAFPGAILNLPIAIVAKYISTRKAKEALAGSSVKLAGRDVLATWKLLVGLVLIPTLYGLYSLIAFIFLLRTDWNWKIKVFVPLTIWNTLPFISYASMRFAENGLEVYRSIRPLYVRLVDRDSAEGLRQNRERLSTDITDLINEYAPKVFNDFDPDNVFRPASVAAMDATSSSAPSTPGIDLQRLASGFFTNAAASMDWLDDRNIFNWSRQEESEADDSLYFLDRNSGGITGSASEAEITAHKRRKSTGRRSRTSSLIHSDGGSLKVESMTMLNTQRPFGELRPPVARRSGFKRDGEQDGTGSEATIDYLRVEDDGYAGDREENSKFSKKTN